MSDTARAYAQLLEAFNRLDWPTAGRLAQPLVEAMPEHPLVRYIAGIANLELGRLPVALTHLQAAASLDPARLEFIGHYTRALVASGAIAQARAVAMTVSLERAADPRALDVLGQTLIQCGEYRRALEAFSRAARLAPSHAQCQLNRASALIGLGDLIEAEAALEACIALQPRYWRAHYSLAQLRTVTPDDHHLERLLRLLPQAGEDPAARTCAHLALAKEYEDLGEYPKAIEHLTLGKRAARPARGYDRPREEALFRAIEATFPVPQGQPAGADSKAPIFVIGMPRSGTTLVDRILSSHPQVHSAGELHAFGEALARAVGSPTPYVLDRHILARARDVDWRAVGNAYLHNTRAVAGSRERFIDKFPHNFLHVGAIARALPNARIVCLRRQPMDTCLSNFRQLFSSQWPYFDYSFDLLDTGHYYGLFDRLMAHWQRSLPGHVMTLHYESLVDAQEESTRALLAFCGLPWDDACLAFEKNAAPVTTPSAVQVRSPLHRRSLQRWKRYGDAMDELRATMERSGVAIADD